MADGDPIVMGQGNDCTKTRTYSLESPESWFEDFGTAKLARGRVRVRLDADFAALVRTEGYHVFLTPEGDSNGLYVRGKRKSGFEVSILRSTAKGRG